jgi:hypothetical protein
VLCALALQICWRYNLCLPSWQVRALGRVGVSQDSPPATSTSSSSCWIPCKLGTPVIDSCSSSSNGKSATAAFYLGSGGAPHGVEVKFFYGMGEQMCTATLAPPAAGFPTSAPVVVTIGAQATAGLSGNCPITAMPYCGDFRFSVSVGRVGTFRPNRSTITKPGYLTQNMDMLEYKKLGSIDWLICKCELARATAVVALLHLMLRFKPWAYQR